MAEEKLRILVVSQYFWPENMRINDLVSDFSAKGHEVTVLTGLPNYPEGRVFEAYREAPERFQNYAGAQVLRVPLFPRGKRGVTLFLNYLSFLLSASIFGPFKLRGRQFDAIFVFAVSPIMAAIPAIVIGRLKKVPVFLWILDLWPETLRAVNVVHNPQVLGAVGKMVSWIYNRADYLLLQSHGFFENVRACCTKAIANERLVYFPSWAEDDFSNLAERTAALIEHDPSVFTVVFAGNLGEAQDFPVILDAVEALQGEIAVRWVIVGDGRMSAWLAEQVDKRGLDNVHLLGRHPLEAMPGLFAQADALLVSLKTNGVFEKTIPGKVQAYLASARPVLAMINGEASRVIKESGVGFSAASGDAQGLASITRQMAMLSPEQRQSMGAAGRAYYLEHYSKPMLLSRLEELFRTATLREASK